MPRIELSQMIGVRCMTADQGKQTYEAIRAALDKGENVTLSFHGVKTLLSLFLNNAIGPLFADVDRAGLDARVSFVDLTDSQREILERVLQNSEAYHRDESYRRAVDAALTKHIEEEEER